MSRRVPGKVEGDGVPVCLSWVWGRCAFLSFSLSPASVGISTQVNDAGEPVAVAGRVSSGHHLLPEPTRLWSQI